MANAPTTFSAIESQGRTFLFYTLNGNILSMVSGKQEGDDFGIVPVKLDGKLVTTPFPRVGATAWISRDGKSEIRLYYIGSTPSGSQVMELCQTDGGKWRAGSLNGNGIICVDDSPISASVEGDKMKVFFEQGAKKLPCMASAPIGQQTWTSDSIAVMWGT